MRTFSAILLILTVSTLSLALELAQLDLCRDIVDRAPSQVDSVFALTDSPICGFSTILNAGEQDSIKHVWKFEDEVQFSITLGVRGDRWRTWSRKNLYAQHVGNWELVIEDQKGNVLGSRKFSVEK